MGKSLFVGGGVSVKALRYDIWEAFFCTSVCIGLLVLFRETFNWTNKLWNTMAQDAFAAYLFHVLVVVGVQYYFMAANIGALRNFLSFL